MNKTCGKCGRKGHNRRTCGKSMAQPNTTPSVQRSRTQTQNRNVRSGAKNDVDIFTRYEIAVTAKNAEDGNPTPDTLFSYEDLETLWVLKGEELNAKDMPKSKRSYNFAGHRMLRFNMKETLKSLTDFIKEYENTNISAKDWYKFFHNFPPELKEQLATEEFANQRIYFALANDRSSIVQRKIVNNTHVEREVLGSVLDKTLQKKPSMVTLETVAMLAKRSPMGSEDLERIYEYVIKNSVVREKTDELLGYGFRSSNSWRAQYAEATLQGRTFSNLLSAQNTSPELFQRVLDSAQFRFNANKFYTFSLPNLADNIAELRNDERRVEKIKILYERYQPIVDKYEGRSLYDIDNTKERFYVKEARDLMKRLKLYDF